MWTGRRKLIWAGPQGVSACAASGSRARSARLRQLGLLAGPFRRGWHVQRNCSKNASMRALQIGRVRRRRPRQRPSTEYGSEQPPEAKSRPAGQFRQNSRQAHLMPSCYRKKMRLESTDHPGMTRAGQWRRRYSSGPTMLVQFQSALKVHL
jgi:hypothetical protein